MKLKTKSVGEITLKSVGTFKENTPVTSTQKVKITQDLEITPPASKRSGESAPTGIKIVNPIDQIEIGKEYVLIAYVIPEYFLWDNLVKFTSDNPDVASVAFGVLKANSVGSCTITATALGTNFTDSFLVTVKENEEITYSDNEIYSMSEPGALDAESVTNWIISEFETAKSGNYKKILFPKSKTYDITPEISETGIRVISIPSDICVDLNGCTLNIQVSKWSTSGGYKFFCFDNCENSSIINGKIVGERYLLEDQSSGNEQCCAIQFYNASKCGLENLEICNSPGFNIGTSRTCPDGVGSAAYVKDFNIESGGYDDFGNAREENFAWRTKTAIWFEKDPTLKYYQMGTVWRTGGRVIDAGLYDILWYKEDGSLLRIDRNQMKFYSYPIPENAKSFNLVFHQKGQPGYTDYDYSVIFVYPISEPRDCYIKNCIIHDNYSTGVAMCGGQRWTIENNQFYNNGVRDPCSDVDYEDGWESMIGDIWRYNTFEGLGYGFTMIAGYHIAIHNNYFHSYFRTNRVSGLRIYHNKFVKHRSGLALSYGGDCVFSQNDMTEDDYSTSKRDNTEPYVGDYDFHIIDQY